MINLGFFAKSREASKLKEPHNDVNLILEKGRAGTQNLIQKYFKFFWIMTSYVTNLGEVFLDELTTYN